MYGMGVGISVWAGCRHGYRDGCMGSMPLTDTLTRQRLRP